jgi:hypothetical protein
MRALSMEKLAKIMGTKNVIAYLQLYIIMTDYSRYPVLSTCERYGKLLTTMASWIINPQNHWVFGLCLSLGILNTRKHSFSETGSVYVLR